MGVILSAMTRMPTILAAAVSLFLPAAVEIDLTTETSPPKEPSFFYLYVFLFLFLVRYLRTLVHAFAFACIQDVQILGKPTLSNQHVTVILPTLMCGSVDMCLQSILKNRPAEVLLVVPEFAHQKAKTVVNSNDLKGVRILIVSNAGKRDQMICGLKEVKTKITVFADDDVMWVPDYLVHLLTAFQNQSVGAAGTNQRVARSNSPSLWNMLGIAYLERRNFNTFATNRLDGSISTLSGRTSAYRTEILQDEDFYNAFSSDRFLGATIKIGDDKALTKRVFSQGYKIRLVWTERAVLTTTMDEGLAYLSQCVRWARSHWQGNAAVVMDPGRCGYLWRRHPWGCYATYFGSLMTPAMVVDGSLARLLRLALHGLDVNATMAFRILAVFWVFTLAQKTIKLWPHFRRHPHDLIFLPALIAFSYLHGFINVYAFLTMRTSHWGNKPAGA